MHSEPCTEAVHLLLETVTSQQQCYACCFTMVTHNFGTVIQSTSHQGEYEIKRCLLLGRKAMTNTDSILKSRDITLPTKVHLVKIMVFPVVMYGCKSWTMKKAENQRIDVFELCCWRRLLRVPWTARRSNQSILKEVNSEYSLEGLMAEAETPILWPPDAKN